MWKIRLLPETQQQYRSVWQTLKSLQCLWHFLQLIGTRLAALRLPCQKFAKMHPNFPYRAEVPLQHHLLLWAEILHRWTAETHLTLLHCLCTWTYQQHDAIQKEKTVPWELPGLFGTEIRHFLRMRNHHKWHGGDYSHLRRLWFHRYLTSWELQ